MTSRKHPLHETNEPNSKRHKELNPSPSDSKRVLLNPADCGLDFNIEGNGLRGHALYEAGFAYCWSGARANVGVRRGKYCFGCKVVSAQPVDMEDTPPDQRNLCRVGISTGEVPVGCLGETQNSYAFGGTGKFSNSGKFMDYGAKFSVGDTIVCSVNLEDHSRATIGFSKNGKWLGVALQFDVGGMNSPNEEQPWARTMFPHILLKNVVVEMQFSLEDGLIPEEGYKSWNLAVEDGNAIPGPTFDDPIYCEVLMMVGLPASGKTTWAEKYVQEHPKKRYVLLGTNLALDQMKVPGLLRKHNYGERFERLMDQATGIFNTLLARASKIPRNYILDQTNVYKSARKRKLKPFANYHKVAVVVFPHPNELKIRAQKRFKEMGKEVPADAVNEMLANYILPRSKNMIGSDELFDEVIFTELDREESQKHLNEMKRSLHTASKQDIEASSVGGGGGTPQSYHTSVTHPDYAVQVQQRASFEVNPFSSSYVKPETSFSGNQPGYVSLRNLSDYHGNTMSKDDDRGPYHSYAEKPWNLYGGYDETGYRNDPPLHPSYSSTPPFRGNLSYGEYGGRPHLRSEGYQSGYENYCTPPPPRDGYYRSSPYYTESSYGRSEPGSLHSSGMRGTYNSPVPTSSFPPGSQLEISRSYDMTGSYGRANYDMSNPRGPSDMYNSRSSYPYSRPDTFY
ncbi:hypothetical protein H6P81_005668 [Aristolochia fimbriata]|uniref:SPRY domain-containing protein n=1 Tax=Aristolochia fimbriata TaxID=158543 RepID=A0AAV7EW98_ARIFI|nr:hypothetical protein H6P81_005668 [Aristolochia fimbriata]